MSEDKNLEILDSHHHFWDLDKNYYPFLCDKIDPDFFLGNYEIIRKNYLPLDYETDSKNHNVIDSNNEIFDELSFEKVSLIAEVLMKKFTEKEVDSIQIVYNKFKNAATQIVMLEQYLPIENTVTENNQKESADYIFEPSKIEIISELIPKSLRTQLFKSIRDSYASEHGARMTAMHKATDNATELRDQLKLTYNKARQAAITNEILEIVGGAEALNS